MTLEATLVVRTANPIDFTVADGTGIAKGALLKITDPLTAIIASGGADMLAGIAAREKVAGDGRTRLAVFTEGIFRMNAGGTIAIGATVMAEGTTPNEVITATTAAVGRAVLGTALEAAAAGQTFLVQLNVGAGSPNS